MTFDSNYSHFLNVKSGASKFFPTSGKIFKSLISSLFLLRLSREVKFIFLQSVFSLVQKYITSMLSSQGGAFLVKMTNVWWWNLRRPRSFPAPSLLFLRFPLLRTEHIQKRRKAKSLDGTYTRSLRMVQKYILERQAKHLQGLQEGASPTTAYIKTLRRDTGMENVRDLVALDTNIT